VDDADDSERRTDGGDRSTDPGGSDGEELHGEFAARTEASGRAVVVNPQSGTGDHLDAIRSLADEHDVEVHVSEAAGEAVELAAELAPEVDVLGAAGGDGTLNEVVRGAYEADALDGPEFVVVPAGTGNNFAGNVGVDGVEDAFELLGGGGRCRRVDLGVADDRPFVNSCICGVTADASNETSSELKGSLGVVAYVVETARASASFDGMRLHVETGPADDRDFVGDALFVLIGNGRRFPASGSTQADVEDGLLDVTIMENVPTAEALRDRVTEKLFGGGADAIHRLKTTHLDVSALQSDPIGFSLDGEMVTTHDLSVDTVPGAFDLRVGEGYDPDPE
jgi:YegS/Rv2252/BmrU family lipid kinase